MPGALPLYFRPPASGLFPRHASSGTLRSGGSDSQNGWMPGALPSYFRHSASGLLPRHGSSGTLGLVGPTAKTGGTGCPAFLFQALRFRSPPTARLQRHAGSGGPDSQNGWMPGALPSYFRHSASGLFPRHGSSGTLDRVGPTAKTGGCRVPCLPISGTPLPGSSHGTPPAARWGRVGKKGFLTWGAPFPIFAWFHAAGAVTVISQSTRSYISV